MKRPNNLWLRVWLLLAWCVLSVLNSVWILPTLINHGVIGNNSWVESNLYTVVATAIMAVIWFKLKHPYCSCWDDMHDPSEEAAIAVMTRDAAKLKTHTGQTKVVHGYPVERNLDCPDEKPYRQSFLGLDRNGNTTYI